MTTLLVAVLYWPRANAFGAGAAIAVGAAFPIAYLVLEQYRPEVRQIVGPYRSGLASYAGSALAMVVGSLIGEEATA
jgi:Na+/proline symporter